MYIFNGAIFIAVGNNTYIRHLRQFSTAESRPANSFASQFIGMANCPDDVFSRLNVEKVELDDLLGRSDYVSVHAPLTPETENMFNMDAFKKMKNSAFLINTARGPLVDIDDLAKALDAGEIAGAGLDVLPEEPPAADNPLLGRDDVVLTPHTGFYSEDALLDLQTTVATDVATNLNGGEPKYPVKPK